MKKDAYSKFKNFWIFNFSGRRYKFSKNKKASCLMGCDEVG